MNLLTVIFTVFLAAFQSANSQNYTFPSDFYFGVATASYQIEGGWNEDGKGENIWDRTTHQRAYLVEDGKNGDVACDSYHLLERDLEMLTELGVDFYRFSISWSRILPSGFANKINQPGIDYYNRLIDGLLARNIQPFITLFHWDLPQPIEDLGGFTNELIVDYFHDYAKVAFEAFGDRVESWATFNEPKELCRGYSSLDKAPAYDFAGIADYICGHNLLKAHARVFHLFNDVYQTKNGGEIGIVLNGRWFEPASDSEEDKAASEKILRCDLGWFANPIYSTTGDYHPILREAVDKKSAEQGYPFSRLPKFTPEEVEYIKGSAHFFGMNFYSSRMVGAPQENQQFRVPSRDDDIHVHSFIDQSWPSSASSWLYTTPWGMRKMLNWIKNEYVDTPIAITENGFSTRGGLEDEDRVYYFREYLKVISQAINEDKCRVIIYTAWSLMDNFEWMQGYTARFGLYEVDFESPNKTRTPRKSANVYRDIIRDRAVIES